MTAAPGTAAADGLARLEAVIPLAARQRALAAPLRALHRAILRSFALAGRAPRMAELEREMAPADLAPALRCLADQDLVVLGADHREIAGAYPFTTEATPHRVTVEDRALHAMCALDAVSIAPMFGLRTVIESVCAESAAEVRIGMDAARITAAQPDTVRVAIEWAATGGHTAHGLCRRMVFVADPAAADAWHASCTHPSTDYSLDEAVEFGAAFFRPLV